MNMVSLLKTMLMGVLTMNGGVTNAGNATNTISFYVLRVDQAKLDLIDD